MGGKVTYCGEAKRMDLNTESCDILLLKLTSQMALDERCLQILRSAASRTRLQLDNDGGDIEASE
jgi:hypothetical protein